jgi:hypothetical protein
VERGDLERWIRDYEAAWRAPGSDAAADLFAGDATYLTHPYAEPVAGLAARYLAPGQARFRDLWIVRLGPDGRCRHFEEWPFAPGRSVG